MENTSKSWLVFIVIAVLVLAGLSWYMTSDQNKAYRSQGSGAGSESQSRENKDETSNQKITSNKEVSTTTTKSMHTITIETNKGTIVIETFDNDAPKTVSNFITLANKGYYNGLIFHRVIKDFMIQGGDPTGTGSGGPGYEFADELNPATPSYQAGYARGTVAMANRGPNTNGSQFFIMHKDVPLSHSYTIFGRVVSGMEVVDAIATSPTDTNDRPKLEIVMKAVTVESTK